MKNSPNKHLTSKCFGHSRNMYLYYKDLIPLYGNEMEEAENDMEATENVEISCFN
jgi:hypothetical protein